MGPAQVRPFIGRFFGQLVLSVATTLIATALIAGFRMWPTPEAASPAPQAAAAPVAPHQDLHLASMQEAFAISHLGSIRDEAEVEGHEPARKSAQDAKPRAAGAKPIGKPVAAAPLPPAIPQPAPDAAAAPAPTAPQKSSLLSYVPKLPSPAKLVDKVASLGDSIVSLVRWRD